MTLDMAALEAARQSVNDGAVTPSLGPWRAELVKLLNDSLATELVCVLRYKRHHFTAQGLASPKIAEEFLVHAQEEASHADRLASRIVQLGGEPDFSPDTLLSRSHAQYDESLDLKAMIRANLIAERVAIEPIPRSLRWSAPRTRARDVCSRTSWPTNRRMPKN